MVTYKTIDEFPYHRIGDDGSVWSLRRSNANRVGDDYIRLKGCCGKSTGGYIKYCILDKDDRARSVAGHTLVLTAFFGSPQAGQQGCHANGVRNDNRLSNLRWDTAKANQQDAVRHGTKPHGSKHYNAKLTEDQVIEIRKLRKESVARKELARRFGVTEANIQTIIYRRSWLKAGVA